MDVYMIDTDVFNPNPAPYNFIHIHTCTHAIKHIGPIYVTTTEHSLYTFNIQRGKKAR